MMSVPFVRRREFKPERTYLVLCTHHAVDKLKNERNIWRTGAARRFFNIRLQFF